MKKGRSENKDRERREGVKEKRVKEEKVKEGRSENKERERRERVKEEREKEESERGKKRE